METLASMTEKAINRGFTRGTTFICLKNGNNCNLLGESFDYNREKDRLGASGYNCDVIYSKGKWAEIVVYSPAFKGCEAKLTFNYLIL